MNVKEYLKKAYRLDKMIKSNMREIEELKALSECVSSIQISDMPKNPSHSNEAPFVKPILKMLELQKIIENEITDFVATLTEIREVIYSIDNREQILCLKCRYLEFMKWEAVANEMELSLKQVHRIHNEALNSIKIKYMERFDTNLQ